MESEKQISLQSGVRTGLGNGVFVTFSSYGHEHSSSGPDELFIATHAVYELILERGEETEVLYLTLDVSGTSSPDTVESGLLLHRLSESTQDVLVLRCCRPSTGGRSRREPGVSARGRRRAGR